MEIILPQALHNGDKFIECASKINYDDFLAKKFVFYTTCSDVDVYELMGDDRLQTLLYGWEVCSVHKRSELSDELCHIVKVLAHHSLHLMFAQEWIVCYNTYKIMLLLYLEKASEAFAKIDDLSEIDWQYLLKLRTKPWSVPYLQQIFAKLRLNKQYTIEHAVPAATDEDNAFLKQESLHIILLRLIKLFDSGSWEAVKQLSLRVMAAWLSCNTNVSLEYLQREQSSITLVAHIYLLAIFVADDNRGYNIDNMVYNIRFYCQSMQEASSSANTTYTPARLIAQICVRLGLGKYGFFEHIMFKKFNLSLITSFAVILDAYISYILGNQILELMAMNENDFLANLSQFKVYMHRYVEQRENSESFLLKELSKLEAQRTSHAVPFTVRLNLNYQQQICKGNRASNIGNYKNYDDDEKPLVDVDEERDRQIDPVFQNIPDNDEVLDFVYTLLAKRAYKGWQFAKIVLLLKIIGNKLNTIEIWRYHPGLTTQFMLNLEHKLSDNYADLAKVFSDNAFMEAEFWLTAFYLHPISGYYNEVKRCSRIRRKRAYREDDEQPYSQAAGRGDKTEHIKYELLSSTIDVDEIVTITNHDAPLADYEPIYKALQALRLPRSIIKDLLTVAFQPRNKRFSWALEWSTLHERCNALVNSTDLKKKFVSLNMAEANDRLKYLKIDYAKYKNRPQLDYGAIEEGYENAAASTEVEAELSVDEDEEQEMRDNAKKSDEKKRRRNTRKYWDEVISEEEAEEQASDDSEAYYTSTGRRRRVRAAAVVANAMISDMDRITRSGRHSPEAGEGLAPMPIATPEIPKPVIEENPSISKRQLGQVLEECDKYSNETTGFKSFANIWSLDPDGLSTVENNEDVLMESSPLMSKFQSLKKLKRETPLPPPPAPPSLLASPAPPASAKLQANVELDEIEQPRSNNSINNDNESSYSCVSTTALRDAYEDQFEGIADVKKEFVPPYDDSNNFANLEPPAEYRAEISSTEISKCLEKNIKTLYDVTNPIFKLEPLNEMARCSEKIIEEVPSVVEEILKCGETPIEAPPPVAETPKCLSMEIQKSPEMKTSSVSEDEILKLPKEELFLLSNKIENIKPSVVGVSVSTIVEDSKPSILEMPKYNKLEVKTEQTSPDNSIEKQKAIARKRKPKPKCMKTFVEAESGTESETEAEGLKMETAFDSTEEKTSRLVQECLTRRLTVTLKKLTPKQIEKLRGVRVRIKRTDFGEYYRIRNKTSFTFKSLKKPESNRSTPNSEIRRINSSKRIKKFVHITSDTPECNVIKPKPRFKRFKHITSDSSNSTESDDAVIILENSFKSKRMAKATESLPKAIRSKARRIIKHVTADRMLPNISDIIELSSGSSSNSSPVPSSSGRHFMHVALPIDMDPLYEEEIVPFR